MIKRTINKNDWRINLPSELMNELGWNKGDALFFNIENDKLVAVKATEEMIKEEEEKEKEIKLNNNNKSRPRKKTPCGLFEFSKIKYVKNKCERCNADYELLINNPGIYCPIAEKNNLEITKNIQEELKYEDSNKEKEEPEIIDSDKENNKINEIDPEIKEQIKNRYNELSKVTIQFLSNLSDNDKIKYSHQMKCPLCNNEMIKNSGIIRNGKLVCYNCKDKIIDEIKEVCELKRELRKEED